MAPKLDYNIDGGEASDKFRSHSFGFRVRKGNNSSGVSFWQRSVRCCLRLPRLWGTSKQRKLVHIRGFNMYVGRKTGLLLSAILGHSGLTAQAPGTGLPVMIFFDSGKSEIRREWAETLDEAIPALLKQPDSVITIGGHSDRSGSSSANRHSSLRRAEAVRDYLTARGVPSRAIAVRAFGEEQPLVATADGVREPQNRRVDIHLSSLPGR